MMETYRAEARLDGKFWAIRVPDVQRSTQARRLREVEDVARELVCLMEDLEPDQVAIEVDVCLPEQVAVHVAEAEALREQADSYRSRATYESYLAIQALSQEGLSSRDIGAALGLSHQRVSQLSHEFEPPEIEIVGRPNNRSQSVGVLGR